MVQNFAAVAAMWNPPSLSKPPTPGEFSVIAVLISGALIVLGVVALVVAFRAPAEKHDAAVALMHYGGWSLGIGVSIAFAFWLVRRFTQ